MKVRLNGVLYVIGILFEIYYWMIIAYVLMSWIPNARESAIGELLGKLVEPYLSPFRRIIPPIGGVIDISPIVALIALYFVERGVRAILGILL